MHEKDLLTSDDVFNRVSTSSRDRLSHVHCRQCSPTDNNTTIPSAAALLHCTSLLPEHKNDLAQPPTPEYSNSTLRENGIDTHNSAVPNGPPASSAHTPECRAPASRPKTSQPRPTRLDDDSPLYRRLPTWARSCLFILLLLTLMILHYLPMKKYCI